MTGRIRAAALAAGIALTALSGGLASAAWAKDPPAAALSNVPKPMADAPYWNASLPTEQRVADLVGRMTLDEKIAQITALWENKVEVQDAAYNFDPAKATQTHPNGIGMISRPSDHKGPGGPRVDPPRTIENSVAYVNAVQTWAREHTRLGIPVMFHEEALHGLNPGRDATSYPQAIGLASTWDPDLLRSVNAEIAGEIRPRGVQLVLSPVVDVARDPRWGRIEETFGEDPYLVSEMGVATVEGLQGPGKWERLPPDHIFATLKHFTGHGQPDSGTNAGPSEASERELRENFFPPFRAVIERTSIAAVMPSYNEIDGVPNHSSTWLLGRILRGEWHFDGMVSSDYNGVDQLVTLHHVAADNAEAARLALAAGVDSELPDGQCYVTLPAQVKAGTIDPALIDRACARVLTFKMRAGLFDNPYGDAAKTEARSSPVARSLRACANTTTHSTRMRVRARTG